MKTETIIFGSKQVPLKIGDVQIACFVLDDKEYLLKLSDLPKALHYDGKSEDWIVDLLTAISKFTAVPKTLFEAYGNPIIAESTFNNKINYIKGIKVQTFIDTCKMISNAKTEGLINVKHLKHAKSAQQILQHLENNNLADFIELSIGFTFFKDALKDKITRFLLEHTNDAVFLWIPTVPDSIFEALLKMNNLQWIDFNTDTRKAAKIIFEVLFSRMPKGLSEQLRIEKPKRVYRKTGKNNQRNHPGLQSYLSAVLSLANAAGNNRNIFFQLLNKAYSVNPTFDDQNLGLLNKAASTPGPLSLFDQTLKKSLTTNSTYSIKKRGQ